MWQKPPTTTFRFVQKESRYDLSGSLVDASGQTALYFHDAADDHKKRKEGKEYPLTITRPDGSFVARIHWEQSPKTTSVDGLGGRSRMTIEGGLLDEDLAFRLQDGSKLEWDGRDWSQDWRLLDYRVHAPFAIYPCVTAEWRPASLTGDKMELEIHNEALKVPGFLDICAVSAIWMAYNASWELDSGTAAESAPVAEEGKSGKAKKASKLASKLGKLSVSALGDSDSSD